MIKVIDSNKFVYVFLLTSIIILMLLSIQIIYLLSMNEVDKKI